MTPSRACHTLRGMSPHSAKRSPPASPAGSAPSPKAPATTAPPNRWSLRALSWSPWLLPFLTVAAFAPAFQAGYVNWDDDLYVRENRQLRSPDGLRQIWTKIDAVHYHPLTFTSYWLEYQLWGAAPAGYHATNIILHAVNALLVYALVRRLRLVRRAAFMAGALFAVHPIQVASVAWVPERKNVLACVLFLAAFLLYLRHVRTRGWAAYGAALAAFALALLSKPAVAALPLSLLAADGLILGRPWRAALLRTLPCVALAAIWSLIVIAAEAPSEVGALAWGLRPLVAARAVWFYVAKLAWPAELLVAYPRWDVAYTSVGLWVALAGLIVAIAGLWRFHRHVASHVSWSLVHFLAGLLPAVGLLRFGYLYYAPVADHLVYFAAIGLFVLAGFAVDRVATWMQTRRQPAVVVPLVACALLGVCAVLTWHEARLWQNPERLWGNLLTAVPDSPIGNNHYGVVLGERGDNAAAAERYAAAVVRWPEYADAHRNLGAALTQLGRLDEAVIALRQAIQLAPRDVRARYNLAVALLAQGDAAGAAREANVGIQLDPDHALAHAVLGAAVAAQGDTESAMPHFERALTLDPATWQAYAGLAGVHSRLGRMREAIDAQRAALRLKPGDIGLTRDLGDMLMVIGDFADAATQYDIVARARPDDADAWCTLGLALEPTGEVAEAAEAFRASFNLRPTWVAASRLAWILATSDGPPPRDPATAVRLAEQARELAGPERALVLDPLAAAYAAAGRFDEAVQTAERALELARAAGQDRLARDIEARLVEYRAGRAHDRR